MGHVFAIMHVYMEAPPPPKQKLVNLAALESRLGFQKMHRLFVDTLVCCSNSIGW